MSILQLLLSGLVAVAAFDIYGYLPEYRYEAVEYGTLARGLTHLILFSLETDKTGAPSALDRLPSNETWPQRLSLMRSVNPDLQILLCYGGFGRSDGFSPWVGKTAGRRLFVARTLALVEHYDLDGVDMNWEYPNTPHEWYSLGKVIVELKAALLERAARKATLAKASTHRTGAVVTAAFYPGQERTIAERFSPAALLATDRFHAMTYDQLPGHHARFRFVTHSLKGMVRSAATITHKVGAALKTLDADPRGDQSEEQAELARLVAALPGGAGDVSDLVSRFTLGLPFYARCVKTGNALTWGQLVDELPDPEAAASAYAEDISSSDRHALDGEAAPMHGSVYGFDGPAALAAKARLARTYGLGGVMIWEVGQDKWGGAKGSMLLPYLRATVGGFAAHADAQRERHDAGEL